MNDIFLASNSKIYGKQPRYNDRPRIANRFCVSIGPLRGGYTLIWQCFNSPLDKHNVNELATPTNKE